MTQMTPEEQIIIDKQVNVWKKEIDRLQDLIQTAKGTDVGTEKTKDAEALAIKILSISWDAESEDHAWALVNPIIRSALTAAEQRGFERAAKAAAKISRKYPKANRQHLFDDIEKDILALVAAPSPASKPEGA